MSDDAYAAFLAKQNQDYSGGDNSPAVATTATPKTPAHPALQAFKTGERVYTSEADEPFEPVLLEWEGEGLPGSGKLANADLCAGDADGVFRVGEFAKLVQAQGEVEVLEVKDWDPRGEYDDVVEAVKKVGNGVVRVYQVGNGARVEYFVVTKSEEGVVGVRAKAVET